MQSRQALVRQFLGDHAGEKRPDLDRVILEAQRPRLARDSA